MYRLEHGVGDKRKAEDATPRIEQIKVCIAVMCVYMHACICMCMCVLMHAGITQACNKICDQEVL